MLGSAGGPRRALPIVGADPFFIVNGDTLTDVDLGALADGARRVRRARHAGARPEPRAGSLRRRVDSIRRRRVTGFVRARAAAAGLVSLHRRADRRAPASSARCRRTSRSSSIGGVYDALIAGAPGLGSRLRLRRRVLGRRHGGRLLAHVAARSPRPASSTSPSGCRTHIDSVRARHAIDSVGRCGGGARSARSTSASSPTACACREARGTRAGCFCAGRTAASSRDGL